VPDNTKVIVLNAEGSMPKGLTLPPPQPKKVVEPVIIVPKPSVMPVPVVTSGSVAPAPATATAVTATASTTAPATTAPATTAPTVVCTVPLVNGVCPSN
jgi:hypothetical protein